MHFSFLKVYFYNTFLWNIDLFQMDPLDKNYCKLWNLLQIRKLSPLVNRSKICTWWIARLLPKYISYTLIWPLGCGFWCKSSISNLIRLSFFHYGASFFFTMFSGFSSNRILLAFSKKLYVYLYFSFHNGVH